MKNSTIVRSGKEIDIYGNVEIIDELPKTDLKLRAGAFGRLFFEEFESLGLPEKIYSNDSDFIEHVLAVFEKETDSMGILLTGKPGLGKSFTANVLSKKVGLPVVYITQQFHNGMFELLNKIENPFVIYIDEFEKIFPSSGALNYDGDPISLPEGKVSQEEFLAFLDGNNKSKTKKLFIITTNEPVSKYFLNRPSRLRYVKEYLVLEDNIIKEVIEDKLENKEFLQDLIDHVDRKSLNIDILIKIIQEINLSGKPYSAFKSFFNFKVEQSVYKFSLLKSANAEDINRKIGEEKLTTEQMAARLSGDGRYNLLNENFKGERNDYAFVELVSEKYTDVVVKATCYQNKAGNYLEKEVFLLIEKSFNFITL